MNEREYTAGEEELGGVLTDVSSEGTEDDKTAKLASAFRTIIEVQIML